MIAYTWYGLSDGEVEDQVNDRLSFSRFAGLGMEDTVPDSTTVCRFRNILVEADLYDTLLEEFNKQLESKGIIVKRGAIVDASITNTSRRPRGHKNCPARVRGRLGRRWACRAPLVLLLNFSG